MPGVTGVGPDAFFRGPGVRGLGEVEPLELHPAHRHHAELLGALQHALQHLPRADGKRRFAALDLVHELAEEERHVVVPRHRAERPEVDARNGVGKALVPARHRRVVVGDVHHVPAEHHVAEAESALERRIELFLVDVLAAQHAVDVRAGDLDPVARGVADGGDHLARRHGVRHGLLRGAGLARAFSRRAAAKKIRSGRANSSAAGTAAAGMAQCGP